MTEAQWPLNTIDHSQLLAGESRRQQILRAALHCFLEQGVAGATIERIRVQSGASTGSLYHHFQSKEAIAGALFIEALADHAHAQKQGMDRAVRQQADSRSEAAAAVRSLVLSYAQWVESEPALARFLFRGRAAVSRKEDQQTLYTETRQRLHWLETRFRPWIDARLIAAHPLMVYHALVMGPMQDYARHWLSGRCEQSLKAVAPLMAQTAWIAVSTEPGKQGFEN